MRSWIEWSLNNFSSLKNRCALLCVKDKKLIYDHSTHDLIGLAVPNLVLEMVRKVGALRWDHGSFPIQLPPPESRCLPHPHPLLSMQSQNPHHKTSSLDMPAFHYTFLTFWRNRVAHILALCEAGNTSGIQAWCPSGVNFLNQSRRLRSLAG